MKILLSTSIFKLLIVACLFLGGCTEDEGPTPPPEKTDDPPAVDGGNRIRSVLKQIVTEEKIPGMIAAIVDSDGIREIEAVGLRKVGSTDSITTDDHIHLGSCTKAMTGTLMATLVDDGLISWETTFIEIFPELSDEVHSRFHDMTVHQLVTNRAGVPANATNWWSHQEKEITSRRMALIKDNLYSASGIAQGTYHYSNLGFMIAGSMAEKVTGKSWEQLMEERIFDPLNMTSAGMGAPGSAGQTDQPWGHFRNGNSWQAAQFDNAEALGPAGRVYSSFEDWGKFIALQLPQATPKILNRSTLDFLIDPVGDYAAGWFVTQRSWAGGTVLNHSGSNTYWYVVIWVAPSIDRAYIVGTNSYDNESAALCDQVIGALIDIDQ